MDTKVTEELNALFAGFLTVSVLAINRFITWYSGRKEKKDLMDKIDSLVIEIKTNGGNVTLRDFLMKTYKQGQELAETARILQHTVTEIQMESRARLEMQLNASPEMTFLLNETGEMSFASKETQLLFGMPTQQMAGFGWLKAIQNQEEKKEVHENVLYSVRNKLSFSMPMTVTSISTRPISVTKVNAFFEPIVTEDGKFLWYFGKIKIIKASRDN